MKTELFRKYIDLINESQDPIVNFASSAHEQWRKNYDPTGTKPRVKNNRVY